MIFRRNSTYYFRARLPSAITAKTGKKELKRSLKTKNLTVARRRSKTLALFITELHYMSDIDQLREQLRSMGVDVDNLYNYEARIKIGNVEIDSLKVDPNNPNDVQAAESLVKSVIESEIGTSTTTESKQPTSGALLLSEAIEKYIQHYATLGKDEMLERIKSVVGIIFVELTGNRPVIELEKADVLHFFREAQKLPKNWKTKYSKGQSINQIIDDNIGNPGLSENTIKTPYKAALSGFLGWSASQLAGRGFPTIDITKHDITYFGDKKTDDNKQRGFTLAELSALISSDTMHKYANTKSQLHKYWLTHICLFTGARIREICQLNPQVDIKDVGGVYCFCLTTETEADAGVEKKLKNKSAKRNIPIHSKLIELGLLEYVRYLQKIGAKRLFPAFSIVKGNASAKASDWFRNELKNLGLRDETKRAKLVGAHAFRHTFITQAHNNDVANFWEIVGHDDDNVPDSSKIYRGPKDAPKLQEIIEQISFDIDFIEPINC